MFKKTLLILGFALVILSAASPVFSQTFGLETTAKQAQYPDNPDIYVTISTTISIVLSMAGLAFLAIMFYAGLRWMTARGNEEFIEKAKSAMFAAIIGFILVTVSYGISAFVFSRLIK
jgi:O-antigen/teichoic acid export membrane protein